MSYTSLAYLIVIVFLIEIFDLYQMKALIKIVTAEPEFSEDQKKIMKRVALILIEHNLSVAIITKVKKYRQFKFKAIAI